MGITKQITGFASLPHIVDNGTFYVSSPFGFYLYKANRDTAVELAQLIFPGNRVLAKNVIESTDDKVLDSVRTQVYTNRKLIINVDNIFFSGPRLFFKLKTPSSVIAFNTSLNEYQYNFVMIRFQKRSFLLTE